MSEEGEPTISLSLVDGISCGLAAALLLFIIFGINLSVSLRSGLAGAAGGNAITVKQPGDRNTAPADIVVKVVGRPDWITDLKPWRSNIKASDHAVLNPNYTVFIRTLADGMTTAEDHVHATPNTMNFMLQWKGQGSPEGTIHIFISGLDLPYSFQCHGSATSYEIISGFDIWHGVPTGSASCPLESLADATNP